MVSKSSSVSRLNDYRRLPSNSLVAGDDGLELAQEQPLPGDVVHQRLSARIGQHPARLLLEHRGIGEPAGAGQLQQLIVRNAAPEEEGKSRRQLEIADPVHRASRQVGRLVFEAEDELRIDEHARQGVLDPGLEASKRSPGLVERPSAC